MVLLEGGDLSEIARSAPAATIVVAGEGIEDRCTATYERLLYPRGRIIGIADPERVGPAVESILFERDDQHDVIAMTDGRFGPCSARLGRGGIRELVSN